MFTASTRLVSFLPATTCACLISRSGSSSCYPPRQFGYIILTTSAGIMDHEEARRKHVAGKIIGFFY